MFVYLPLTDNYGKTEDGIAYKTSLSGNEAGKINWKDWERVNFPSIWNEHFVLSQW
jgi:hypothetical protein